MNISSKLTVEVNIKIVFFWVGETCGLAVQPDRNIFLPKMEAATFSKSVEEPFV